MRARSLSVAGTLILGALGTPAFSAPAWANPSRLEKPAYQTTVPGESVEADRVDLPVAPGIVRTTFDTFGRAGWTRVHVLGADLRDRSTGVDLIAGKVSEVRPLSQAADAQRSVAAVNGDFFNITETNAAIGPEIQDGRLRKGTDRPSTVVGVGTDGIARLADLMIKGTVTVAGAERPLAALNSATVPADGIAAFTPQWGPALRTLIHDAGPYTELVVRGGEVTAVSDRITTTPVPDDGLVLLGRGTAAAALAATTPGDAAALSFAPQTTTPLRMALGSGDVLVRGGRPIDFPPSTGNDALKPRTAIGWRDGGRRLLLVTVDGSAAFSAGLSFDDTAKLMARLGATEAFMLDGGGSSELVARRPGDTGVSVVNRPSDGNERPIPNGVGLFSRRGSGTLQGLDVRPNADRVFLGLSRDVAVAGHDETYAPVPIGGRRVDWSAAPGGLGRVTGGVFRALSPGSGRLRARSGPADGEHELRVLGPLHRLSFTGRAASIDPGETMIVGMTGFDADGFDAAVAPRDVSLDYDHDVIDVAAEPDGRLRITGRGDAGGKGTTLTASVRGVTARLPVTVGLIDRSLAEFEPAERWTASSARATASVATAEAADRPDAGPGNHALRLTYDFTGQPSTSAGYAVAQPTPITLPAGAKGLALWVKGDGRRHWLRATLRSQGTTNVPFTFAESVDWTGWRRIVGTLPGGFSEPITLTNIYVVETAQDKKDAGELQFDGLAAQVGQRSEAGEAPKPDPYVLEQRGVGRDRWTFAVMSDLHVSAAAGPGSFPARQAATALDQAVAAKPDFLLINGDFVDGDRPEDFAFATGLLRDHVPAGLPVYWTPGNHESGTSASGTLDAFVAATGRPTRQVFDHKGTRFILLDSHSGSLRTSDWAQVPKLRAELTQASADRKVTGVVVVFHHPPHDPSGAGTSELSDQLEAGLVERWLADFREGSGKPAAVFSGHAHTAAATRADGVLEVNTPAVGKTPYSSADQGGFFGWMRVGVDADPARVRRGLPSPATRDWLEAESRPVIDGIELSAPERLTEGASGQVSATGVTSGFGLRFPLRYPASVTWSGGAGLVVAESERQARAARLRHGTRAVLDLTGGTLTAVRPGTVTLTVASGGHSRSATVTLDPRP
ncbi:phosphodiester glycosidase family protein [Actinomadura sp. HBU206391]|uniref:phosphodiester glycosidase family protein n=1 Tax=Actinomadura sp. HBU206391 TaxID=2731692 RepID=UPI0016500DC1|nr:phosphodiester glycosidase family protein [Actinomadura sp. HBU206391]MBC6460610.1 phosphodiester glycosidase family protein [Actinomadura sp. HBU206391]